jgi:hypothetical protein
LKGDRKLDPKREFERRSRLRDSTERHPSRDHLLQFPRLIKLEIVSIDVKEHHGSPQSEELEPHVDLDVLEFHGVPSSVMIIFKYAQLRSNSS